MAYQEFDDEQARQVINAEQAFEAYRSARDELRHRFPGSMSWKTVDEKSYLYRAQRGEAWKSLGPRSPDTELAYEQFRNGRDRLRARLSTLSKRIDRMAGVNRAYALGRIPRLAARILRALADAGLTDPVIVTVGTNALYAYERMAGLRIAEGTLETNDIDLLYDARSSLKLLAPEAAAGGVAGILRKVDPSFEITRRGSFRAANSDGYLVDLITPMPKDVLRSSKPRRIGSDADDLVASEIEGLVWLVNSPKVAATVFDTRGYPARIVVPDPRAFALHKAWLAKRDARDPLKRQRDRAQAETVARLIARRLPHLAFDDPALNALPAALREQASSLVAAGEDHGMSVDTPDW